MRYIKAMSTAAAGCSIRPTRRRRSSFWSIGSRPQPDVAALSYAAVTDPTDGIAKDAKFDMEGFKNVLKLRAEIEGQWGGHPPSPEKYVDLSYYNKALAGL